MILKPEQILPLVHNVLKTELDEADRLHFCRFTPEQIADYALDRPDYPMRCHASANMTLDFVTDSDGIEMAFDLQPGSYKKIDYGIDLFVDGTLLDAKYEEDVTFGEACFALPAGTHRVTVFLPWSAELILKRFALSDGASVEPAPPKSMRIIALGDSITQGFKVRHPGCSWVGKVTRDLDAEVYNLGVGGYRFLTNSLMHPTVWQTDLILLAYGTNDYTKYETVREVQAGAASYVERLTELYPKTPVLLMLPIYRKSGRSAKKPYVLEDVRQLLREIAKRYPQITVMESAYYPHHADFFAPDLLHPNDLGFAIQGEKIVQAIRELGWPKRKQKEEAI